MESQLIDEYTYYQEDEKTSYFVTKDGRKYAVIFEEQSFVENSDFILANRTYEVFLTLQKAPPAYFTDPRIGATVTALSRILLNRTHCAWFSSPVIRPTVAI